MMRLTKEEIGARCEALASRVNAFAGTQADAALPTRKMKIEVLDGESIIGGGAAPSSVLATRLLALRCEDLSADELAARLRGSDPAIIARVEDGRVLLDLRTVFPDQDQAIADTLQRIA
jgi:L-seryl-tRNA(Ser) seleniumtransferase